MNPVDGEMHQEIAWNEESHIPYQPQQQVMSTKTAVSKEKKQRQQRIREALLQYASRQVQSSLNNEIFAPYSPTPLEMIVQILHRMEPYFTGDDNDPNDRMIIDIGCGTGNWLKAAWSKYQCLCVGIEHDAKLLHTLATEVQQLSTTERASKSRLAVDSYYLIHAKVQDISAAALLAYIARDQALRSRAVTSASPHAKESAKPTLSTPETPDEEAASISRERVITTNDIAQCCSKTTLNSSKGGPKIALIVIYAFSKSLQQIVSKLAEFPSQTHILSIGVGPPLRARIYYF